MNMQLRTNVPQSDRPAATQAQCLRTIAGAPVGYSVRRARQGSFLVLVIGTLALLAVITIVYVALGNQDSRTKTAVIKREQLDDVPAGVSTYLSDVIARDVFSVGLDGSVATALDPSTGLEVPGGNPEAILRRETDDAPGVAHDPANPAGTGAAYLLTSDRTNIATPEDAKVVFTPWGGLHDGFVSYFSSDQNAREDFAFSGNFEAFRLTASDPYLASTSPTYLNFNASLKASGQSRDQLRETDFVSFPDAPYVQRLDWYSISNPAPDGLFVNLDNLRDNFDVPHHSFAPTDPLGRGIGFGKSLLERRNTGSPNDMTFTATTVTDWGFQPPLTSTGTNPGVDERMDDVPFYWTMRQMGAFRPARVSTDNSEPTENPGRAPTADVSDFKLYQWADADGDGMLDSRWWEMDVTATLQEDIPLPKFSGDTRWFFASRIVDLSGLINVNFAGDLAASPAETYSFFQGGGTIPLLQHGTRNFVMPLGMSPGDIDLRRILMLSDSYANYKANPAAANLNAAYDLMPGDPDQYTQNSTANEFYGELKAMYAGSAAYANLRLSNHTGLVLGLDPINDSISQIIDTSLTFEDQRSAGPIGNPPQYQGLVEFADRQLGVGIANQFDALGRRPWQTMMFPTRPWQYQPGGASYAMPPFGGNGTPYFNGWLDWSSRRTINYLSQSRKLWNTSTDSLTVNDTSKQRFGVQDLSELLDRYSVNNPEVTSPLEVALGFRDASISGTSPSWEEYVDVLRSNRPLKSELETYDPVTDAFDVSLNDNAMRTALRRRFTDVRQYITTLSGSRPLRNVASTIATKRVGNAEYVVSKAVDPQSLSQNEVKINAREVLDLPPRPSDGLKTDTPPKPPKVESAESAARILFEGYFEGLAPYASLDAAWDRNDADFNRVRTLFYGYRGAELAALTSATMAVNMVDLADGPTFAPLMDGPTTYNPNIGRLPAQLQPVRPGPSDPRNKSTIRTMLLSEQGSAAQSFAEQLDDLTRSQNNNVAAVPGSQTALGAMFPTWQAADDIEQAGSSVPKALDNLDISGTGKLAPDSGQVVTPVVNVIGVEPQVFVTQVTTMTVYFDNYGDSGANGYNAGVPNTTDDTVKLSEPNIIANPGSGQVPQNQNVIFDGATTNQTEVLFKLVAFKLTNPFDRDVILGKPMFSDIPPTSALNSPTLNEPMMPDSPLELVVDPSVRRYPFATQTTTYFPNTDPSFPFRYDLLPIFSRGGRWAVGGPVLANLTGYPSVISGATWNLNPNTAAGVIGAYGRGDQVAVNTDAFLDGNVRVDHISDFNYVRFGSRMYMLMSLNEQMSMGQEAPLPNGGPQSGISPEVRRYRDYDRPDVVVPIAELGSESTKYKGTYSTIQSNPAQKYITLNPIRVPAGKTIVAYALSEAPNRILERLAFGDAASNFGISNIRTPVSYATDGLVDDKPYADQGTFIKRVLEKQISAGAVRDNSGNQVHQEFASDIFNENGAYWIPMIWDPKDQVSNPNFPNAPEGFTNSGLQDLRGYVNPIPKEAAVDLDRNDTISPDEAIAQRTVTLWRTVRQNRNTSSNLMDESKWDVLVPQATYADWSGLTDSDINLEPSAARRPPAPNGSLNVLRPNDYRNDQMQDRLRIPARLDMSVAFRNVDVNQSGTWTNSPLEVVGTDTNPSTPNSDQDRLGYSAVLWSSVRRPSDPRSAELMIQGIPQAANYKFLYRVPEDILPAYCLEAKYWEDHGPVPIADNDPLNLVKSWNLVSESPWWREYKAATRSESFTGVFTKDKAEFSDGTLGTGDSSVWKGGATSLRLMLGYLHGFQLGSTNEITEQLNDPTMDGLTLGGTSVLSSSPQFISPRGYGVSPRTLRGTIDQKPNATVMKAMGVAGNPDQESLTGPFELFNSYFDNVTFPSGRLTYAELTAQVSQDADRERGNQSNNFYRDVDMRSANGLTDRTTSAPQPDDFNEDSNYTRWVSTLRSADLLRPLGVGPLESPAVVNSGGQLQLRCNFLPRAASAFDIQNNNARYTTLGEALACAMGYENRDYATATNNLYRDQQTRDINLLRSPYQLTGEPNVNHPPFHLKPPPRAMTGVLGGTALLAGDDSSLTLLFDRGNLWVDRFVPFIESNSQNEQDCVMNSTVESGTPELPVGPGLPAALMALEQFETPATDPQALEAIAADNKVGLTVARQGPVNINTAPIEVLRALPGLAPRQYVIPSNVTGAGNPRPSTFGSGGTPYSGDVNWFSAYPDVRPLLPVNQNTDMAAGIAAYRDMTPVLMSRSAMESAKITAGDRATGALAQVQPVAVPFLTPDADNLTTDPFFEARNVSTESNNVSSNTQIPGINKAPGLRSTAELLAVRARSLTQPNQYVSRWPSGDFNSALANPNNVVPRHHRWKAAPWALDQLGYDVNLAGITTSAAAQELNSSFGEIDGVSGRSDFGTLPGSDNPYSGVPAGAVPPAPSAARNDPSEAIRGVANEYEEQLISANNVMNTVTNRSDVFAVWFVAAGFQRSDVEGLEPDEALIPSVQRRFLMIVDRSNVVNKGEKPRILLMKEVPMDSNVQ